MAQISFKKDHQELAPNASFEQAELWQTFLERLHLSLHEELVSPKRNYFYGISSNISVQSSLSTHREAIIHGTFFLNSQFFSPLLLWLTQKIFFFPFLLLPPVYWTKKLIWSRKLTPPKPKSVKGTFFIEREKCVRVKLRCFYLDDLLTTDGRSDWPKLDSDRSGRTQNPTLNFTIPEPQNPSIDNFLCSSEK